MSKKCLLCVLLLNNTWSRFKHNYLKKKRKYVTTVKRKFLKDGDKFAKHAESEPGFQTRNDRDYKRTNKSSMDWPFVQEIENDKIWRRIWEKTAGPVSSQETDPIDFWKSNSKSVLCLSALSQVYLCVSCDKHNLWTRLFRRLICHHTRGVIISQKVVGSDEFK